MSRGHSPAESDRSGPPQADMVEETEQWFISQGLPHFVADYTATEDVLPRASPILVLSFLVTVTVTLDRRRTLWRNVGAGLAVFLVVAGLWAVANRVRGRPALRVPETVGPVAITVFLFGPAVLNVAARRPRVAGRTILVNLVLLAVVYYATSYGLVSMTVGNFRHVFERVGLALRLVGRTFPVLFVAVTFLLFNGSAWESTNTMPLTRYLTLLGFFFGITLLFIYRGVAAEFETVRLDSPDEIRELCADTPVGRTATATDVDPAEIPPLTRNERLNVVVLATYGFVGYVTVVTLVMFVFFVLFGLLMIPSEIVADLLDYTPDPVLTVTVLHTPVTLTRELLRVSGFFAAFSGLYFAVHAVTDQTFRKELDGTISSYVHRVLAVRAVYRVLVDRNEESAST